MRAVERPGGDQEGGYGGTTSPPPRSSSSPGVCRRSAWPRPHATEPLPSDLRSPTWTAARSSSSRSPSQGPARSSCGAGGAAIGWLLLAVAPVDGVNRVGEYWSAAAVAARPGPARRLRHGVARRFTEGVVSSCWPRRRCCSPRGGHRRRVAGRSGRGRRHRRRRLGPRARSGRHRGRSFVADNPLGWGRRRRPPHIARASVIDVLLGVVAVPASVAPRWPAAATPRATPARGVVLVGRRRRPRAARVAAPGTVHRAVRRRHDRVPHGGRPRRPGASTSRPSTGSSGDCDRPRRGLRGAAVIYPVLSRILAHGSGGPGDPSSSSPPGGRRRLAVPARLARQRRRRSASSPARGPSPATPWSTSPGGRCGPGGGDARPPGQGRGRRTGALGRGVGVRRRGAALRRRGRVGPTPPARPRSPRGCRGQRRDGYACPSSATASCSAHS